jgi:hypothetical protein
VTKARRQADPDEQTSTRERERPPGCPPNGLKKTFRRVQWFSGVEPALARASGVIGQRAVDVLSTLPALRGVPVLEAGGGEDHGADRQQCIRSPQLLFAPFPNVGPLIRRG